VSQQVRRLERYLDTTLFQRLARGLVLTEEGRDYLPELSAGFDLLGESTARLRTQRAGGVLTLTTLAAFANGWLLPRLHRFHERAPRVEVVLRTSRTLADFKREDIETWRSASHPHPDAACTASCCAGRSCFRWRARASSAAGARRTRSPLWPAIRCCTTSTLTPSNRG
jgi:DNA-binding transcriptional LysR family regulator